MNKDELFTLNIVFQPMPDASNLVFVEVETEDGRSVDVGEWASRGRFDVLRLRVPAEDIRAINSNKPDHA
jgi:hypothetical protein